jgi:short-subunit dehydrogenase
MAEADRNPMEVDGATVLVTGASSGIGAALARLLAERGATVGLLARREDRLAEVLADCRRHSPDSAMWVCDLADPDDAAATALAAWDHFGHLDVLVNNAAIPKRRFVQAITPAEVDETMRVNFTSPVRMTLAVLPRMLERDRGMFVNVSSMGGRVGIMQEAAYSSSKFALCGWSESMAADLWATGVEVRLIVPGPFATEIWDQPGNDPAHYDGELEPPTVAAEAIVAAIEGDAFECYVPDLRSVVEFKTANIDLFLEGMANQ